MPAKLDRCVQQVMRQGKSESQAFAICNAAMKNESTKMQESMKTKETIDKNGDIVVAENVKFYINSGISITEEKDA